MTLSLKNKTKQTTKATKTRKKIEGVKALYQHPPWSKKKKIQRKPQIPIKEASPSTPCLAKEFAILLVERLMYLKIILRSQKSIIFDETMKFSRNIILP